MTTNLGLGSEDESYGYHDDDIKKQSWSLQPTSSTHHSSSTQNIPLLLLPKQDEVDLGHHDCAYPRHVSLELLNPTHDSALRKSTPLIAMFNLVATVCGGGVLTLSMAFARAGIIPTTILMVFAAASSDFCLYILCSCARRTGSRSYGDICQIAFGSAAEIAMNILLFISLCGALVAFQVLAMQIWTQTLLYVMPNTTSDVSHVVLAVILVVSTPLLLKRDLHALRYTCYVGFASLCLLTLGLIFRACQGRFILERRHKIKWFSTSPTDVLFTFPIVTLCFYCTYNVLSVHGSLVNPTRDRVKFVLDGAMLVCLCLFYAVGLCGYLYAYEETSENILLNFPMSDQIILFGRIGYGFTIMFGLPLLTLPCREALLCIPSQIREWRKDSALQSEYKKIAQLREAGAHLVVNGVDFDDEEPHTLTDDPELQHGVVIKKYGALDTTETNSQTTSKTEHENELSHTLEHNVDDGLCDAPALDGTVIHVLSTFGIVVGCYVAAILVPGVAIVWSICGSTVTFLIGFIIPTACYLRIRSRKKNNPRSVAAWILLFFFSVATIVCTYRTLSTIATSE